MNQIAADSGCCFTLLIGTGHCLCFCCSCYCSLLAASCMHNSLQISNECFEKNCLYLASLNSHLHCFRLASVRCSNEFLHQVSFLSIDSAFFESFDFYNSNMKLSFDCYLDLYIQLSLNLLDWWQGRIMDDFITNLNSLISQNWFHSPFTAHLILLCCHYYCNSDFAPAFHVQVQSQVALFHPVQIIPNYIFLHLSLHLLALNCFYSFQKLLFLVSFEQFGAGFQNRQLGFELNHFHLEASFRT